MEPVAPEMVDHVELFADRCHWYVVPVIADPPSAHEPSATVKVDPSATVPVWPVPPEFDGAVAAARIVKLRDTVWAVA